MKVCLIYSGWLRTWEQCRGNHAERLTPAPAYVVHYNETTPFEDEPYTVDEWGYDANKAGENQAWNTMNMWRAMWRAWREKQSALMEQISEINERIKQEFENEQNRNTFTNH